MATRMKHLAQPKPNFLKIPDRESPEWKVSVSALKAHPSDRVCLLALPRHHTPGYTRESPEWEVTVSAMKAHPSDRVSFLALPRQPALDWQPDRPLLPTLSMGIGCMTKASPRICKLALPKKALMEHATIATKLEGVKPSSSRIEFLATSKLDHPEYRPDRPVSMPVPKSVLGALVSNRLQELATPKPGKSLSEGVDPYKVSLAALAATPSSRIEELSLPLARKIRPKLIQN